MIYTFLKYRCLYAYYSIMPHTHTQASEGRNLHPSTWRQMDVTNQLHNLTTLTSQKGHTVSYTEQAR
jgi:hypothetical protein